MLIVACDMDDVTFNLVDSWLDRHDKKFNCKTNKEDIKSFEIHKYVKAGLEIYNMLEHEKGMYLNLPLNPKAKETIEKILKIGHFDVCFASASPKTAYFEKHMSIKQNFPDFNTDNIIFTKNKALVNAHFLIDDGMHNIKAFRGIKILYSQPWNANAEELYNKEGLEIDFLRVDDWVDIEILFDKITRYIDTLNIVSPELDHLKFNSIKEVFFGDPLIIRSTRKMIEFNRKIYKGE